MQLLLYHVMGNRRFPAGEFINLKESYSPPPINAAFWLEQDQTGDPVHSPTPSTAACSPHCKPDSHVKQPGEMSSEFGLGVVQHVRGSSEGFTRFPLSETKISHQCHVIPELLADDLQIHVKLLRSPTSLYPPSTQLWFSVFTHGGGAQGPS